ncbi:ADP-specific phosphofructokinase [Candidatus Tiddalikarchaeum anstoanum]|nr:ADP-specific phosphofructokinase [Candidatus Tiddalikarchaeum anstoanum]
MKNKDYFYDNLKRVDKAFIAFNINTDAIISIGEKFLKIIDFKDVLRDCRLPNTINSMTSLKEALAYSFVNGSAQELKIENEKLYNELINTLPFDERRIGGQAGIVANTLSKLGVKQVIVYSNMLSVSQAKLFEDNVVFPIVKDGEVEFIPARDAGKPSDPTRVNIIIEYKEGTRIELKDGLITIPRNSRLIISHQPYMSQPLIPKELLVPELFKGVKRIFLSGYHHIKEEEAGKVFSECIKQIKLIKKFEKDCMVHVEYVDLHKDWIKKNMIQLLQYVDSFGLNEVETLNFIKFQKKTKLSKDIEMSKFSAESLVNAGLFIAKKFKLKRVNVHFIDFIISITDKKYPISVKNVLEANMFGMRAVNSRGVAGEDFIKELGRTEHYGINEKGVMSAEKKYSSKGFNIVVVPNLNPDKKIEYTVGLGDTVSSSTFFGELVH